MAIPSQPNPYPTLVEGKSIYHPEHTGFAAAWNWIKELLTGAEDNFALSVNDRHGDISIVAGEGIDVTADGNTITISIGSGESVDNDAESDAGGGEWDWALGDWDPGTAAGGHGADDYGEDDDLGGRGRWTDAEPADSGDASGTSCNEWSEDERDGLGDTVPSNEGDNCAAMNGW